MDKRGISKMLRLAALALPVAVSLPLVAGFFGAWHPAFDSFAHFRAHLALATVLAAMPALFIGYWKEAGLSIALGIAAFATTTNVTATAMLGQVNAAAQTEPAKQATYRLLHLNARFDNKRPEMLLSLIGRVRPDIVALNEVSAPWVEQLKRISAAYPYQIFCEPSSRVGPAAIVSRRPFAEGTAGRCHDTGAMATAEIDLGGRTIGIAAIHLKWPWPFSQSQQIDRLAGPLSELGDSALAAGDLNATPWSHAVARIAEAGGLSRVSGSTPTWLTRRLPVSLRQWIGLPIDHIFSKGAITIQSVRIAEDVGSDHAPLLVEFSLAPRPAAPAEEESATTAQNRSGRSLSAL